MSGHSKWSSIKHKKGAADAKRGKLFSKMVKEITVAAKTGGDIDKNPRLRLVVQKAKDANMPADNIDRAIKKGTGELPGVVYDEMIYEGYGPGGVGFLIEALTDNKNRTSSEVRSCLDKREGNMAGPGAVAFQFSKKSYVTVPSDQVKEDRLMDVVLSAGAEDMKLDKDCYEIISDPKNHELVRNALDDAKISVAVSEITMLPNAAIKVTGADARKVIALVEALEDLEDVQNVYANFDIPDEELES